MSHTRISFCTGSIGFLLLLATASFALQTVHLLLHSHRQGPTYIYLNGSDGSEARHGEGKNRVPVTTATDNSAGWGIDGRVDTKWDERWQENWA